MAADLVCPLRYIGVMRRHVHRVNSNSANLRRSKLVSEKPQSGVESDCNDENEQPFLREMSLPCHSRVKWSNVQSSGTATAAGPQME